MFLIERSISRLQFRLFDRELLDRRSVSFGEGVPADHRQTDQAQREDADDPEGEPPYRQAAAETHSTTSKKPIQPSSANSDLWAWNMYLPGNGNLTSRIPRCPCICEIVSVNSVGSKRVPVG